MDRNVRVGDTDRDRAADALRRHFAEGRLSPEEFDERLSQAFAARTMGDLADLLADLPEDPGGYALPVPVSGSDSRRPVATRPAREPSVLWRVQLASYATTSAICVLIWLVSGHPSSFWPIWIIGPWGIVLIGQAIRGPSRGGPPNGHDQRRLG